MKIFERHPLPWAVVPEGSDGYDDIGGVKDANGEWVLWLGDGTQYYPTSGYAEKGVLNVLTMCINMKGDT